MVRGVDRCVHAVAIAPFEIMLPCYYIRELVRSDCKLIRYQCTSQQYFHLLMRLMSQFDGIN